MTSSFFKLDLKQKPNKREKIIFSVAIVLLVGVFAKSCVMASQQAIADSEKELTTLFEEQKALQKQEQENPASDLKQHNGNSKIAKMLDLAGVVNELTGPKNARGVDIEQLQVSEIKKEGSLNTKDINLNFSGSFSAISNYLEHLENMRAPLIIKRIGLQKSSSNSNIVSALILGGVYAAN